MYICIHFTNNAIEIGNRQIEIYRKYAIERHCRKLLLEI